MIMIHTHFNQSSFSEYTLINVCGILWQEIQWAAAAALVVVVVVVIVVGPVSCHHIIRSDWLGGGL